MALTDSETTPSQGSPLQLAQVRRFRLREAMQALEDAIGRPAAASSWADEVEAELVELGAALAAHIDEVESPAGLLEEIIEVAPRLSVYVDIIRVEHSELVAAWDAALGALREAAGAQEVRRRVTGLLGRLARHRQRGSDLVYEAYNVDIAAGD